MRALNERFSAVARAITRWAGSAYATMGILMIISVWLITGPLVGFTDTWQLVINTATTIVTNVLAFVILNAQNRDTAAVNAKLDAIIVALEKASNSLVGLEEQPEHDIKAQQQEIRQEAERAADRADKAGVEEHDADT